MTFTDRFFKFPVRIYDRFSAENAAKAEENNGVPTEGEWREGLVRVPYSEIVNGSWSDYFDSEQGVEGVDEEGFICTLVVTVTQGIFICTWPLLTFENALNEYEELYMKCMEEKVRHERTFLDGLKQPTVSPITGEGNKL